MRKEMSCKSSRSHGAGLAGAIRRCRRSGSVGCEKARNARECPARAHHRSVRVRAGRVYGCRVLARGQKTIYADAGRVHGVRGTDTADREISTQIQSRRTPRSWSSPFRPKTAPRREVRAQDHFHTAAAAHELEYHERLICALWVVSRSTDRVTG